MMYNELKTPCFIVNKQLLDDAVFLLKSSLEKYWNNYIIGYSFKTNSLPWVVKWAKDNDLYAEVVSDDEYELSKLIEFKEDNIIYNGPMKSKETFIEALNNGCIVNVDTKREVEWLKDLSSGKTYKVGVRVNFDLESICPTESACGDEGGRFGFCYENGELKKVIEEIELMSNVSVCGIHLHCSSKTRSLTIYKAIAKMACKIKNEYNIDFEYIDIGGGFFGGMENRPKFPDYLRIISEILKKTYDVNNTKIILEPGMSIIGPAIDFVTSVIDVKDTTYNRFVVTDGSRINIDPLMTKSVYFYDIIYQSENRIKKEKQVICGFTCMEHDRLFVLNNGNELAVGDKIIYHKVGAYTMCLSPLFIKYFPVVKLNDNGIFTNIRNKWDTKAYSQYSSI